MIATRQLVMEGVWVVGRQNADIVDALHIRDVAMVTIFGFLCMRCTLAPLGEYDWTIRVRQRCGLMSKYCDHLLLLLESHGYIPDFMYVFLWLVVCIAQSNVLQFDVQFLQLLDDNLCFFTVIVRMVCHLPWPGMSASSWGVRSQILIQVGIKIYTYKLECGPMPNVMVALPNIGGALCSTLESLADAHY